MKRAEPVDALRARSRARGARRFCRIARGRPAGVWCAPPSCRGPSEGSNTASKRPRSRRSPAPAGVTKGTFYFHFADKEDILLELGWGTAEVLYNEALNGVRANRDARVILRGLLHTLARRVESVPKKAIVRAVGEFYRGGRKEDHNPTHFGITRAFALTLPMASPRASSPPRWMPGRSRSCSRYSPWTHSWLGPGWMHRWSTCSPSVPKLCSPERGRGDRYPAQPPPVLHRRRGT